MNRYLLICRLCMLWLLFVVVTGLSSCRDIDTFADNPEGNFEALWSLIDERYCFFEYKNIDWDDIYWKYKPRINNTMTDEELFNVLADMLAELKDGHVNLTSPFNMARYWDWYESHPTNFDMEVIEKYYLNRPDYQIAGGIKYRILPNTNMGYMYYESFSSGVGESNLDYILAAFSSCDAIIIDVRSNSGGMLTNVDRIASRFTNEDLVVGYIRHKTGPRHNQFSDYYPLTLKTAPSNRIHYQKPVAVLTNRRCYSATNQFVSVMTMLPNVVQVGDTTGGGSGFPLSSELPNGWSVRFSSSPIYNANKKQIEFGIGPYPENKAYVGDYPLTQDGIIERAIEILNKKVAQ